MDIANIVNVFLSFRRKKSHYILEVHHFFFKETSNECRFTSLECFLKNCSLCILAFLSLITPSTLLHMVCGTQLKKIVEKI